MMIYNAIQFNADELEKILRKYIDVVVNIDEIYGVVDVKVSTTNIEIEFEEWKRIIEQEVNMKISGIHVALHDNAIWLTGTAANVRIKYACGCVKIMPIVKALEYFTQAVRNSSESERGTNAYILSQIRAGKIDIEVNEEM